MGVSYTRFTYDCFQLFDIYNHNKQKKKQMALCGTIYEHVFFFAFCGNDGAVYGGHLLGADYGL